MNTSTYRPSRLTWLLLLGLLLLGSIGLFAEQRISSPASSTSSCLTPLVATDSSSSAAEAEALLPLLPAQPSSYPLIPEGPLPGEAPPSPDDLKAIYGYDGPYYNTSALDGEVAVLARSLYAWPTATWKVTGLVRNQTRCPIKISGITARLYDSSHNLLGTTTATFPISILRAGEPGPFVAEYPIAASRVASVEWQVSSTVAVSPPRSFTFAIEFTGPSTADSLAYKFYGTITNRASSTAGAARVVIAWLDSDNRVLDIGSTVLNPYQNPTQAMALSPNESTDFLFSTNDISEATLLSRSTNFALWGIAQ